MSNPTFYTSGEPSELSIRLLTLSLRSDCENRGVSSKNYVHRSRVIRQQTELLARGKPFTIFRSAAEEAATKAAHDVMDNEAAYVTPTDDRS